MILSNLVISLRICLFLIKLLLRSAFWHLSPVSVLPMDGGPSALCIHYYALFLRVVVPVVVVLLGVLVFDLLTAFVVRESNSSAFSLGLLILG